MKVIIVANQKGGVAKTTTAGVIASAIASKGFKVLGIDMDPQANFTDNCNVAQQRGVYEVLKGEARISDCAVSTGRYDVLPASILLAAIEQELNTYGREYRLKEALSEEDVKNVYDYVVIDTPPALGTLTVNALVAADYVLIPTMADINATKGISQLNETINAVRKYYNPELRISGILLTRFNPRLNISKKIKEISVEAAKVMNTRLFDTYIRASVAAPESHFMKTDLAEYSPDSTVFQDYEKFMEEFWREVA